MVTAIENVEDLVRRPEIKYGIVRGGATQTFFAVIIYFFVMSEFEIDFFFVKKSDVKIFQRMWAHMQQSDDVFVATNEEGINKVL